MHSLRRDIAKRIGIKEEHLLEDEFEREIRRKSANWDFIRRQRSRVRAALELYIMTGDLRLAQHISGMGIGGVIRISQKSEDTNSHSKRLTFNLDSALNFSVTIFKMKS